MCLGGESDILSFVFRFLRTLSKGDRTLQRIFDEAIRAKRFSGPSLLKAVKTELDPASQLAMEYSGLTETLGKKVADHAFMGAIRATFLIELVKEPKIETTKFEVRWANRLPANDPRHASFRDCLMICESVLHDLTVAVADEECRTLFNLFAQEKLLAYEVPLDYRERRRDRTIHTVDNLAWFWDEVPARAVRLRYYLLSQIDERYRKVFSLAYGKIEVKTYLTDRVLTGDHKTNREKRWETHPGSVHFALRRDCLDIERTLIEQVCKFDGFPKDLQDDLVEQALINPATDVTRCPITLEPLSYAEFERELRDPNHGKASFQVGHLNPLKAVNDDPRAGHTAQNIAWVSADGNRIQGSLSLADTRELLRKTQANYTRFNIK